MLGAGAEQARKSLSAGAFGQCANGNGLSVAVHVLEDPSGDRVGYVYDVTLDAGENWANDVEVRFPVAFGRIAVAGAEED